EVLARPFVGKVILAVRTQDHAVDIRARPDDVDMLAAVLLVHDDGAGLALKLQFFFKNIDGMRPLFPRHGVVLGGIDIGVVEALAAARPLDEGLPVAEGLGKVGSRGLDFDDFDLLVGVTPLEMPGELARCRAAATLDNHGSGPCFLPRAALIRFMIWMQARRTRCSSGRPTLSPELRARAIWLILF